METKEVIHKNDQPIKVLSVARGKSSSTRLEQRKLPSVRVCPGYKAICNLEQPDMLSHIRD
ncbi:Uncharacterised protein [uncultured archaeon]|nr:Uncharacterised protein [uncultured archaeon]